MNIVEIDFETYWADNYSLSSMDPASYVMDARFCIHGAAVALNDSDPVWVSGLGGEAEFKRRLHDVIPPEVFVTSAVSAWNCRFDASILAWRLNIVPGFFIDPMAYARGLFGPRLRSLSLDSVSTAFGMEGKMPGVLAQTKNKQTHELDMLGLSLYGIRDLDLSRRLRNWFMALMPEGERDIVDTIVRMFLFPQLRIDRTMLNSYLSDIRSRQARTLADLGVTKEELRSDAKFANLLRQFGVALPMKHSIKQDKPIYAFSKTDREFVELATDDTQPLEVQALVAARLGIKSTMEESRTQRLIDVGAAMNGLLPVPLRYAGAHTGRLSGDYKINLQNLGRKSPIRGMIHAPPGYQVVKADASQIEARLVAWLAGQTDLVEAFRRGEDVYASFASDIYGYRITKDNNPVERFLGKTAILGLGFGMAGTKFDASVTYLSDGKVRLGMQAAMDIVRFYRARYPMIPILWQRANQLLNLLNQKVVGARLGPITTGERGLLALPNGLALHYPDMQWHEGERAFIVAKPDGKFKKVWPGLLVENIIQALARIIVMDAAMRIKKSIREQGLPSTLVLQVHDELAYVVRNDYAARFRDYLVQEMSHPPAWGPDIPLAAEGSIGTHYAN